VRAQSAAGEISVLSGASVQIAEQAGAMLARVVPDIQRTADLVQEISGSSREQSEGTTQVNSAIQQFDEVVQRNASAAEEMASTAEELSSQAMQMQQIMAFFTFDGAEARAAATSLAVGGGGRLVPQLPGGDGRHQRAHQSARRTKARSGGNGKGAKDVAQIPVEAWGWHQPSNDEDVGSVPLADARRPAAVPSAVPVDATAHQAGYERF
jgi:methyl-accepting chemotaxis protein